MRRRGYGYTPRVPERPRLHAGRCNFCQARTDVREFKLGEGVTAGLTGQAQAREICDPCAERIEARRDEWVSVQAENAALYDKPRKGTYAWRLAERAAAEQAAGAEVSE